MKNFTFYYLKKLNDIHLIIRIIDNRLKKYFSRKDLWAAFDLEFFEKSRDIMKFNESLNDIEKESKIVSRKFKIIIKNANTRNIENIRFFIENIFDARLKRSLWLK